jgi:C4-dicarboxylate transporter DctM subunit
MLIAGALAFNYVVTIENIPETLRTIPAGFELSPGAFLILFNVILLIPGCFLEGTAILLISSQPSSRPRLPSVSTWCISASSWW